MRDDQKIYCAKHGDDIFAIVSLDEVGNIVEYKAVEPELSPYLGTADLRKMKLWWESRAVPGSRKIMETVMREAGCPTGKSYLAKNLGLSMTDQYWLCPKEFDLSWDQVNFFINKEIIGDFVPYHSVSSYDPNASLGGDMEKYWDISTDVPTLVKTANGYYGQQAINEEFASFIHSKQNSGIDYVNYKTRRRKEDDSWQSVCDSFVQNGIEFIPAIEILDSEKRSSDVSQYDHFIRVCVNHGLDEDLCRSFLDYQTLTDFIITNVDKHFSNFGILRDCVSLKFLKPAPIFDSGNSMFYRDDRIMPYNKSEILDLHINSFHNREEKILPLVHNRCIVDYEKLPGTYGVKEFYMNHDIPEQKCDYIARNYNVKKELLKEYQNGNTISAFIMKQKDLQQSNKRVLKRD